MKNLKKYQVGGTRSNMELAIPLPRTPEGRVYRYSPNEDAHPRHFVIGDRTAEVSVEEPKRERMRQEPGSSRTICPYSGAVGDDDEFTHPEDREAARKIVEHAAVQDVRDVFSDMLKRVASKSRGTISYKPGSRPHHSTPRFGRLDLMRLLVCDCCGRDYGVYAIALYCPDCGAPNISLHFAREVELVLRQVSIAEDLGKEQHELAYRLLGNAHEDVLTAFEAAQKTVYLHKLSLDPDRSVSAKPVRNDFQNVGKAQRRFGEFQIDPFHALSDAESEALELNIQKRHVIGHNLGVVDAKFAENARDARLGETVELVGTDIREFARLCQLVVSALDDWIADMIVPNSSRASEAIRHRREHESDVVTIGELSALAMLIGRWLCESSEKGLPDIVDEDAFLAAFCSSDSDDLLEALGELQVEGLIVLSHVIGPRLPRIRTTEGLFQDFDPVVLKSSPLEDAIKLVELVLNENGSIDLAKLHEQSELTLRRFNPAATLILAEIGEGRVSRTDSPDYPARHFAMIAEDRTALKRLRRRLEG